MYLQSDSSVIAVVTANALLVSGSPWPSPIECLEVLDNASVLVFLDEQDRKRVIESIQYDADDLLRALRSNTSTSWWWETRDLEFLRIVETKGDPPQSAEPRVVGNMRGAWWCEPNFWNRNGIVSAELSQSLPDNGGPVRLWCQDESAQPFNPLSTSPVSLESLRLYVINSPQDWRSLVKRYPRKFVIRGDSSDSFWFRTTGIEIQPDWTQVAKDYDGIHLTIGGYVTTAYVSMEIDNQYQTTLSGWNPGEAVIFDSTRLMR